MTDREKYKLAFSVLQTDVMPEQVIRRAREKKGVFSMKRKFIPILIGAILIVLLGTAAAVEANTHWLSGLLGNVEEHPEIAERIEDVSVTQTVDGTIWTIDHLLVEGRVVFWQLTKSRADGTPVEPYQSGNAPNLALLDENGEDLGIGFTVAIRRIDDGSDPSTCTLLYQAKMLTPRQCGEELAGMTLLLEHTREGEPTEQNGMTVRPNVPIITLETKIQPYTLRQTVIADGTGLNVGRLSVELQGSALLGKSNESAAAMADGGCALVLKDGRELPVQFSLFFSGEERIQFEYWQVAALPEIIDPQDAAAFRVGDTVYPLQDK